ncbi:MAG TPA: TIGR04219 family outer membrane beta-barrel protein, partial [Sulfurimonas autotrophica]|nr:TIGR04219 family outer membrane beta-barrel protein [Sulfurimonas autotrophica]
DEKQETSTYAWMFIKHPIPVVPNIRLEYASIYATGKASGAWNGLSVLFGIGASSVLDMKQYDIIPYYNILDNTFWITLDLGVDIKVVDTTYEIESIGYEESYTAPIPLLYARTRAQIPTTDIGIEGDIKYVTTGSSTVYDARIKVDYTFDITPIVQPAIEIGYRVQKIKIDEDDQDVKTDMDFSGLFAGLMLRF